MLITSFVVEKLSWIDRVVSYVWVFLSLLMLVSLYLLYGESGFSRECWLIVSLIIATWTYPIYTLGFKLVPGLFGNLVYGVFLLYVITQVYVKLPVAAWLLTPISVWITVATIYVIAQIISQSKLPS
jgi:tryptophan-rich sensory protein